MRGALACVVAGVVGGVVAFACGSSGGGGEQPIVDSGGPETPPPPPPSDASDDRTFPSDAPANEQVLGGTRLKPKIVRTSDGATQFLGWHDIMLDVDCSFAIAEDGALRCLPSETFEDDDDTSFAREFTDMACKTPFLMDKREGYADACPLSKYFASRDETTCPRKTRVEPIGAPLGITTYSYSDRSQPCVNNQTLSMQDKAYALGAEILPSTFVGGVVSMSAPQDGVAVAYVTGDDGSKGYYRLVDTVHQNEPCVFARAADGKTRCLPDTGLWGIVWEDLFVDSMCTTYWAQLLYYSKCPTKYGWRYSDRGSTNPNFYVHPIGDAVIASPLFRSVGSETCMSNGANSNPGFTTGPEVPAATFSEVMDGPKLGTGRLVRFTSVTSGGIVVDSGWFDTMRNARCEMLRDATGTLRCMPVGPSYTPYYSDDKCTKPVYQDFGGTAGSGALLQVDLTQCPARYRAFAVGPTHVGAVYGKYSTGPSCTLETSPPTTIEQGAEIPATDLADAVQLVVP